MDKGIWKEAIRKDANKEGIRSHNRCQGEVRTKKKEGISAVKRREKKSEGVCKGAVAKEIHLAIKVTTNSTSILCREERWKEADSARLQVS